MSWTRSSGESSTLLISSKITMRSRSSSSASKRGASTMSESRSTAQGRSSPRTLAWKPRVLLGSESVGLPADLVHFLGDPGLAAALGALEHHVLDEVREPHFPSWSRAGSPRFQPYPDRHRRHMSHLFGEDRKSVIQNLFTEHPRRRKIITRRLGPSTGRRSGVSAPPHTTCPCPCPCACPCPIVAPAGQFEEDGLPPGIFFRARARTWARARENRDTSASMQR